MVSLVLSSLSISECVWFLVVLLRTLRLCVCVTFSPHFHNVNHTGVELSNGESERVLDAREAVNQDGDRR